MDFKVVISPRAIRDLGQIVRYISFGDPKAAEQFGNALIDEAMSLGVFPERGRLVSEFDDQVTREIIHGAYRIIYRVDHGRKTVWISRFWHGARLL